MTSSILRKGLACCLAASMAACSAIPVRTQNPPQVNHTTDRTQYIVIKIDPITQQTSVEELPDNIEVDNSTEVTPTETTDAASNVAPWEPPSLPPWPTLPDATNIDPREVDNPLQVIRLLVERSRTRDSVISTYHEQIIDFRQEYRDFLERQEALRSP